MLYPLFVEGVTDYADGQLWKVDPLFNKLDIIVLLLSVVVLVRFVCRCRHLVVVARAVRLYVRGIGW